MHTPLIIVGIIVLVVGLKYLFKRELPPYCDDIEEECHPPDMFR